MKVLYFTKYSRNGASSRLRSYQYFPLLEADHFIIDVKPFFDEAYLNNLYSGKKNSFFQIFKFYFNRFFQLFLVFRYDKIVIEKELFPYFFSWFEGILNFINIKYIVDYDDAIFHNYNLSNSTVIRFLLKNKIENVMKYSQCVVAGNSYLAEKAKNAGAKKIVIIPTVIDLNRYKIKNNYQSSKIKIGWIGSPSTLKYLKNKKEVFEALNSNYDIEFQIVGGNEKLGFNANICYFDWSESLETELILNFDIGIMPLENSPWEQGKCAYKLIQYMACGIPVVASNVGMNSEVVFNNTNGFLVDDDNEWIQKLSLLIENENLRANFGQNGRKIVEKHFQLQKTIGMLKNILKNE